MLPLVLAAGAFGAVALQRSDQGSQQTSNQETDEEYANGNFEDDNYAVVHRLCVDPEYQNQKIGYRTMMMIESLLKEQGISSIRLDAFSKNPFSLKMYEKLGYKNIGSAQWRKGLFYLYEKKL